MIKRQRIALLLILLSSPAWAQAQPEVAQGSAAKALHKEHGKTSETLSQINKSFVLKTPDGKKTENPPEMTIPAESYLFIVNEEEKTVHNVYDSTDQSWILEKQLPSGVAAVKFHEPGVHQLRCAIHPQMRIKVNVVEEKKGGTPR